MLTDYDLSDICDDCGFPGCLGTCDDDPWMDPEWDSNPWLWLNPTADQDQDGGQR